MVSVPLIIIVFLESLFSPILLQKLLISESLPNADAVCLCPDLGQC